MILYAIQEYQDWSDYPDWESGDEPSLYVSREKAAAYIVEIAYARHETRWAKALAEKEKQDAVAARRKSLLDAGLDPADYGMPKPSTMHGKKSHSWYVPDYLHDKVAATTFSDEQIGYRVVEVETMD